MPRDSNKTDEPYVFRVYSARQVKWEVRVPITETDDQGGTRTNYLYYREVVTTKGKEVPESVKIKRDEFLLDPRCLV